MGQILHGSARMKEADRRAIHYSQESPRVLAKRYGINLKTVHQVEASGGGQWLANLSKGCALGRATNLKQTATILGATSYNSCGLHSALAWSYDAASANAHSSAMTAPDSTPQSAFLALRLG